METGDKIRIIKKDPWGRFNVGDILIMREIFHDGGFCVYKDVKNYDHYWGVCFLKINEGKTFEIVKDKKKIG